MAETYHHGNLRAAILDRARAIITDEGVEALSLRQVATELGVSHAAPRHHFASRRALLTAIAAEGFTDLAAAIERAQEVDDSFIATGLAYLRFALDHPADFTVMFTPSLHDGTDPVLAEAAGRALGHLQAGAAGHHRDATAAALAGWSLIHGFAELARSGALAKAGYAAPTASPEELVELGGRAARLIGGTDLS